MAPHSPQHIDATMSKFQNMVELHLFVLEKSQMLCLEYIALGFVMFCVWHK